MENLVVEADEEVGGEGRYRCLSSGDYHASDEESDDDDGRVNIDSFHDDGKEKVYSDDDDEEDDEDEGWVTVNNIKKAKEKGTDIDPEEPVVVACLTTDYAIQVSMKFNFKFNFFYYLFCFIVIFFLFLEFSDI